MHPLIVTVAQRLGLAFVTLFVVSLIIFACVAMLPGDFARAILGQTATPETVAAFQHQLGLDQPAAVRYVHWVIGVVTGDFGSSFTSVMGVQRTVSDIISVRLANTLFLAGVAALVAIPLSIILGVFAALYRNTWFDRAVSSLTLTTISFPEFFVAYVLMYFLAIKFPVFDSLSNISPGMPVAERLSRSALPVMTLTLVTVAHMMRMTRAALIGVLASPYIEMARLKGASKTKVIFRHALPNAWAPIVNVVAFNLAYLLVGAVVVEVVFVYPGIGQAMVDAVRTRDVPVVQACALIFAVTYIILNLVADVISIATNPRLLHPR